jgi:hypothetical protein
LIKLCVTEMKLDLLLNQTSSKFSMNLIETESFWNPKNESQDSTKGFIKNHPQKKRNKNKDPIRLVTIIVSFQIC